MSLESDMRGKVVAWLRELDPVSVENSARPGTPDVNYADGWLELKSVDAWPSSEETPLRLDHYTPQQRVWHVRRARAGGKVHVLLKVENDWMLLSGDWAAAHLGHLTRGQLLMGAVRYWSTAPGKELAECLKSL